MNSNCQSKKKNNSGKIWLILIVFLLTIIAIYFLFCYFKTEAAPKNNTSKSAANTKKLIKDSPRPGNNKQKLNNYQPVQPTQKEAEYQGGLLPISSAGTEYKKVVSEVHMLPRGAAILTNSGDLGLKEISMGTYEAGAKAHNTCANCGTQGKMKKISIRQCNNCGEKAEGDDKWRCEKCHNQKFQHTCKKFTEIKAIIHACPGSIKEKDKSEFVPNMQGIIRSVQNSILLAERNNYKSIAFCLIGSNFLDNIIPPAQGTKKERQIKLAEIIIKAAAEQRKTLQRIVLVDFGNQAFHYALFGMEKYSEEKMKGVKATSGVGGDGKGKTTARGITDYSFHQCEVIVNSLNMEGEFINSGSFSGFIARQTGSAQVKIQNDLRNYINEFNKRILGTKNYK